MGGGGGEGAECTEFMIGIHSKKAEGETEGAAYGTCLLSDVTALCTS